MAIYQELTGQGRVLGGRLAGGAVLAGGSTPFSKNGDLSIQHSSNPFKRQRINAETVNEWEELDQPEGVAGAIGLAAARVAIPGRAGKALGAGLGAALNSGHTVRVGWVDGTQSIIALPEKQFMVLSILLKDRQVTTEPPAAPNADAPSGAAKRLSALASSVLPVSRRQSTGQHQTPAPDATEQIAKLASLHAQGILTDAEFAEKKTELLKRL